MTPDQLAQQADQAVRDCWAILQTIHKVARVKAVDELRQIVNGLKPTPPAA